MNQRGSIGIYLLFSIAISAAAGYGVYRFMRDHKDAFASTNDDDAATTQQASAPTPKPAVAPTPAAEPEVIEPELPSDPMKAAMLLAESRAVNPNTEATMEESPVFGIPGIEGGIERGSVERRFKPRAAILQRCYERSGGEPGQVRVKLQVEPDGKLSHIELSAGWDDGFQACVMSALNFQFSATKDGNPAAVVQPIAFR
jgi:hypothetical protein